MARIQAVRGMNDILPADTPAWRYLEDTSKQLFAQYGLEEIRTPIVESTDLFKRSIGEVTDIVEKEMYTFEDRNGDSLTLRPEGTASVVRACEEHGLLYNQTQRLFYSGPMFRHERPQKGRYRQFHQIGVECFGFNGPDVDAELIVMTYRLWQRLGLADQVRLQINSLGTAACRDTFRSALLEFLRPLKDQLDEDSQRRLDTNPLRILDSKNPHTQGLLADAPRFEDFLSAESKTHFESLCRTLDAQGVPYEINPRLVRGLDYYCLTVFEWVTDALGAQGTVCAGGRYDGLVEQLGGKACPAVGFAMGIERLILLLQSLNLLPETVGNNVDIYIVAAGAGTEGYALEVAEVLRAASPLIRVRLHHGGGSFKSQLKKADKSGAVHALIIGEGELADRRVTLKSLRSDAAQETLAFEALPGKLNDLI